jgi:hypothetical protein
MRLLAAHAGAELFAGARFHVPGFDEATDPLLGLCPLMTCSSPVAPTLLIQLRRRLLAMPILIGGRSAARRLMSFGRIQPASPRIARWLSPRSGRCGPAGEIAICASTMLGASQPKTTEQNSNGF